MDPASREGANEAARLAVNAPLDADNSDAERVWELYRTVPYRLGLSNTFDLG
ncbi:hypothetical protein ACFW93_16660 [Streptomyces canus]|uniref:hypothetical protein n=1 Tax=Streptomyces canus TaxID=58343 RepID=UPI0036C11B8F